MTKKKFIVDTLLYPAKILILYRWKKEETLELLQKMKYGKEMLDAVKEDGFEERFYGTAYHTQNENGTGEYLLIIHKYKDEEEMNEVLVHETNHLASYIATRHGFIEEMEATAYLQEYLFKEIKKGLKDGKRSK